MLKYINVKVILADVVEQADTRDLKSLGGDFVPVQIRSSAPVRGSHYGRKKSDEFFSSVFYVTFSLRRSSAAVPDSSKL